MPSTLWDRRNREMRPSRRFSGMYVGAFAIAALIGLVVALFVVLAGLLHFHPLW